MNIYVGSLSYDATEDEVREIFSPYGEIASISIITDKFSGKSKGFGFVEIPEQEAAENAIKSLDGSEMKGRNIKVNEARPREERPKRGGY